MQYGQLKLVILDRDGVINRDSPDFIKQPDEWHPLPGAIEAIVDLQQHFWVCICTNQSGVGRGLLTLAALDDIHDKLMNTLDDAGGSPLNIFFCPHLPDAGCSCRKPKPGLLNDAMQHHGVTPDQCVYVGDSMKDILAARNAGTHTALVLTGNGKETREKLASAFSPATEVPACYNDLAGFTKACLVN